jgi:hypothetical protein
VAAPETPQEACGRRSRQAAPLTRQGGADETPSNTLGCRPGKTEDARTALTPDVTRRHDALRSPALPSPSTAVQRTSQVATAP